MVVLLSFGIISCSVYKTTITQKEKITNTITYSLSKPNQQTTLLNTVFSKNTIKDKQLKAPNNSLSYLKAPVTFVDTNDPEFLQEMEDFQKKTGKHWLDQYKNGNPDAKEYLAESGKLMLMGEESMLSSEQFAETVQKHGGRILTMQPEGRRYLSFSSSTDLQSIRQKLFGLDGITTVDYSLLGKGKCNLDYDNHNRGSLNNEGNWDYGYHLDTVQALCKTYPPR
ncbi:MAG: hypothetical protein CR971_02080 [candidate division SR1 bacterium]|nr:MAG: hypothetical protein CR971_02080 [candidate division SR1 bacterium]